MKIGDTKMMNSPSSKSGSNDGLSDTDAADAQRQFSPKSRLNNDALNMADPPRYSINFTDLSEVAGEDKDENIDTLISVIYGGDLTRLPGIVASYLVPRNNFHSEHFSLLFAESTEGDAEEGQCLPDSGARLYWIDNQTYIDFSVEQLSDGLQRAAKHLENNASVKSFLENHPAFLNDLKESIKQMG